MICDELQRRVFVWERSVSDRYSDNDLYDMVINLPPGSSKSLIISVYLPAWIWLTSPAAKIITASYSYKIAEELSGKSLGLMQSDIYKGISTFKLKSEAVNNIKNSKGGQRFVTSTGGTVTGVHADFIICDDINSPQSIHSEVDRAATKRFITEVLPSRKTNLRRSCTIYVQQRLHNDDATGITLSGKRNIKHICVPAINESGLSFFPERFSLLDLDLIKTQLGSVSFMAQYMQITQDANGGIIKKDWLVEEITTPDNQIYFLDSAYGGKNADDNAIVGVYKRGNNLVIQSLGLNKYEFPELIKWLKNNIPARSKVYIEGKASGKSIIQTLKLETDLNIIEIKPTVSKIERKHSCSPFFESGRIIINKNIKHKETLIEQLIFDNTKHDDALDVVMHSIEQLLMKKRGNYDIR